MQKRERNKEPINIPLLLIGIFLVISGFTGALRTYCLNKASFINTTVQHPVLINACIRDTAPISYSVSAITILIGLIIAFWNKILDTFYDMFINFPRQ